MVEANPRRPWWNGEEGRERLLVETEQLTVHGYQVLASQQTETDSWRIVAEGQGSGPRRFIFDCYGNYPLTRPRFEAYGRNGQPYQKISSATLSSWRPTNYLYEVCQDARQQVGYSRRVLGIVALVVLLFVAGIVALIVTQLGANQPQPTVAATAPTPNNPFATIQANTFATITANAQASQQAANQTATAIASKQAQDLSQIQATVDAQNNSLLTATAGPAPTPTLTPQPTPAPTAAYKLSVREVSLADFQQGLSQNQEASNANFHWLLLLSEPMMANQIGGLRFPGKVVALPKSLALRSLPIAADGLGCQPDQPCQVQAVDANQKAVSLPIQVTNYKPDRFYVIFIERA